jgi:hypothetical protein
MLWRLARVVAGSRVAEEAVAQLIGLVKTKATPSLPAGPGSEQARLEMLEDLVRDHDHKLATIADGLEKLSADLRPLIARSAITFWLAISALTLSLICIVLLFRR